MSGNDEIFFMRCDKSGQKAARTSFEQKRWPKPIMGNKGGEGWAQSSRTLPGNYPATIIIIIFVIEHDNHHQFQNTPAEITWLSVKKFQKNEKSTLLGSVYIATVNVLSHTKCAILHRHE